MQDSRPGAKLAEACSAASEHMPDQKPLSEIDNEDLDVLDKDLEIDQMVHNGGLDSQLCAVQQEQLKQVMKITKCPHTSRKHYAKNMCSSCYRKYGRNQYAHKCPHKDRLLYSMGMCQTCYLSDYHKVSITD